MSIAKKESRVRQLLQEIRYSRDMGIDTFWRKYEEARTLIDELEHEKMSRGVKQWEKQKKMAAQAR